MMQKCENCGSRFRYRNVQISFLLGNQQIYCDICNTYYDAKRKYRLHSLGLLALPIVFLNLIRDSIPSTSAAVVGYLLYGIVVLAMLPFTVKYKKVETIGGPKKTKKKTKKKAKK